MSETDVDVHACGGVIGRVQAIGLWGDELCDESQLLLNCQRSRILIVRISKEVICFIDHDIKVLV